jgi:hypothetical protein
VHFPPVRARDNSRWRGVPAKTDQLHNEAAGKKHFYFIIIKTFKMIHIFSPQKGNPGNKHVSGEEIQEGIYPNHQEENVTDGDEFLDDAIRMKDQPLDETDSKENK